MFYSQFILAKKGPLGTIWIAAHLERKLRKNQVADTDIGHSVDSILFPDVPIALRLSSHLLLGVVRIYSRKVNYLFDDCSEALLKVKQAFRSTAVDLPPGESTAPYHSITLPETFDLDDFELPDNDLFQGNFVDHHVSTREQITLQDTMDGTTYSTSQFGLDERFGDGDTSQIGLDLEEELFSEKVVTPAGDADSVADPQAASTNVNEDNGDKYNSEPITVDHDENQIGGLGASAEILNCPQTPFTPGLLEEPIDDDFTCDGHLKSDDHNSKELMEIENMENVPGKLNVEQVQKDGVILSCENDTSQGPTRDSPLEENGHVLSDVEMNQANSNTITLDGTDSVKNVQDGVINNEKVTHSSDPLDTEMIDSETCMDNSCQRVSGSGAPEGQTDIEGVANAEVSCLPGSLSATDDLCASKSSGKPEHSSDPNTCQGLNILGSPNHGETSSIGVHVLRPCSSHPNQDVMSSQGMADVDVTESSLLDASSKEDVPDNQPTNTMKPASEEGHLSDPTMSEVQPDNNSCGEVDNNQNGNPNTSEPSDLPAPEKLLSVPEVLANRPNDLLESTPATEGPVGGDAEHTETTQISGKKRSFTESTLTVQSLNSDESFRVSRSKKTAESIPDDDDLLSSILVGRRSSGLKMKPTPSAPEVASSKRVRSTQRPSTSKRKVLVDDAMVLHGDTIRQQLMSTEDIRRLRKKAPCTRPEILLIQRQFLEDEIFNETIFTGMSGELACLYSGSFDLSRIRVCENVNTISSSEPSKAVESSIRPTATEETEHEDRTEVTTLEKNVEVESETNIQSESHKDIDPDLSSHDTNVTMAVDTCHESLQNQNLDSAMEIETERLSLAVDSEHHSAFHGPDSSSTTVPVAGDHKTEEYLGSGQLGAESISPDRKSNAGVHEHASLEITTSEKEADAIEGAVENASIQVHGRSEYRAGEEGIELEENKDCAPVDVRADTSSPGMENTSYKIVPPEGGSSDNLVFESNNQPLDEFGAKRLDDANVDIFPTGFPCEDKDKSPSSSLIHGQEPISNLHMVEYQMNVKNDSIKTGECQVCDDTDIQNAMDAESTVINQPVGEHHEDLENITVENDTEFLNEDDDEVPEEGDGGLNASEEIENSGWSSRTRAVAKYLQNSFYKESLNGRKALSVDNLVSGKTRKEASRMFFETLVLKTRDYIHVEQAKPLDNIIIKPRVKLMKAEF